MTSLYLQNFQAESGQPIRHLRDDVDHHRDRRRSLGDFLRRNPLDRVRRRVMDGEVARRVAHVRHRWRSPRLRDGIDVGTAAAGNGLRQIERREQRRDVADHVARREAA